MALPHSTGLQIKDLPANHVFLASLRTKRGRPSWFRSDRRSTTRWGRSPAARARGSDPSNLRVRWVWSSEVNSLEGGVRPVVSHGNSPKKKQTTLRYLEINHVRYLPEVSTAPKKRFCSSFSHVLTVFTVAQQIFGKPDRLKERPTALALFFRGPVRGWVSQAQGVKRWNLWKQTWMRSGHSTTVSRVLPRDVSVRHSDESR